MWAPRSTYHQAEYPLRTSGWGQAVRRAALGVAVWAKQTWLPYLPWRVSPSRVPPVRTWQNSITPVVTPFLRYTGEAPLRLQPEVILPHPSGLDPTMPVAPERR